VAAPELGTISIPDELNVIATYPIAVTKDATKPAQAQAFIQFILSPQGQEILMKWGLSEVR
jgi:molybdate transport system substrate-binding protein